jgi:predicted nucleotidyltransferase
MAPERSASLDPDTERAVRAFLEKAAGHYDVTGAIVFGSRTRGRFRPDSDTDVAVLLRGRAGNFIATMLALADLAYDVLLETGIYIEPLPIWDEEWANPDAYSNPRLLRNIEREGIRL